MIASRLALIVVVAVDVVACGSPPSYGDRTTTFGDAATAAAAGAEPSLEYQLAAVEAGSRPDPNGLAVARFRSLLNQLSTRWSESPVRVADMSVMTQQQLRQRGIAETLLNIMEGMNQLARVGRHGFPEFASYYVVLRNSGQTHERALAILRVTGEHDFPGAR